MAANQEEFKAYLIDCINNNLDIDSKWQLWEAATKAAEARFTSHLTNDEQYRVCQSDGLWGVYDNTKNIMLCVCPGDVQMNCIDHAAQIAVALNREET